MKHLFVSYDTAKALKELGFDEPELRWWTDDESGNLKVIKGNTHQQVVDWFREKHKIVIILHFITGLRWFCHIINDYAKTHTGYGNFTYFDNDIQIDNNHNCFETYTEALNTAIDEAIKLITK